MGKLGIEPVFPQNVAEIAGFLLKFRAPELVSTSPRPVREQDVADIERRIRWLLVDNPAANSSEQVGFCLRDEAGGIRGLTLCFPALFQCGQGLVSALGSGSYFVDKEAHAFGYYLFRRYLSCPGYSFYFATTCNTASASLWKQLGGLAVRGSEIEYILPLRFDSLVALRVANRTASRAATEFARVGGRCIGTILNLISPPPTSLAVESCEDWEKLAELSRRHQRHNTMTSARSEKSLRWRYGPASPAHPCKIYLIRDHRGNEGWFALSRPAPFGGDGVLACTLLDAVWAQDRMSLRDIVPWIIRMAPDVADAVLVRCRPDTNFSTGRRWLLRRRLSVPRAYVVAPRSAPALPTIFDYDDNDHVAWN